MIGARLWLQHPLWAARSCDDCKKYLYREDGSRMDRGRVPFRLPVLRAPGTVLPCHSCPKIPLDAPERHWKHAIELSDKNAAAWRHYRQCAAVGRFPVDALVERHALLLATLLDDVARSERDGERLFLAQILTLAARR